MDVFVENREIHGLRVGAERNGSAHEELRAVLQAPARPIEASEVAALRTEREGAMIAGIERHRERIAEIDACTGNRVEADVADERRRPVVGNPHVARVGQAARTATCVRRCAELVKGDAVELVGH